VDQLINIAIQLVLLPIAFIIGRSTERKHFKRLEEDELRYRQIRCTNLKRVSDPQTVAEATVVLGHVVIATDYWKSFVTKLRNLVGGEMRAAQSLMIRGRREAMVRMLKEAHERGATEVWNVRFGFASISQMRGNQGAMQVEIYAWGTAVTRRREVQSIPSTAEAVAVRQAIT